MAFQRRQQQQGGNSPALSVALSVKEGNNYLPGPKFGFWPSDGGPAFRGTLKGDLLTQVLEALSYAQENGLTVTLSVFDNSQQQQATKQGGFQPRKFVSQAEKRRFDAQRKPNPFKQQEPEPEGPQFS